MKKLLALALIAAFIMPLSDANAKAVKLGRGKSATTGSSAALSSGSTSDLNDAQCTASSDCPSGKYCKAGTCINGCGVNNDCPSGQACRNNACEDVCASDPCASGDNRLCIPAGEHGYNCFDYCYNVQCATGFSTVLKNSEKRCCCEEESCPSGQEMVSGQCVSVCRSYSCAAGQKKVVRGDTCTCESACEEGYSYNSSTGKCVKDSCPAGCSKCTDGKCTSCSSGYGLKADGTCIMCSCPAMEGCVACYATTCGADGIAQCSKCSGGYYLKTTLNLDLTVKEALCVKCPANATCDGKDFTCKSGYTKNKLAGTCELSCGSKYNVNGTCMECIGGLMPADGVQSTCSGYLHAVGQTYTLNDIMYTRVTSGENAGWICITSCTNSSKNLTLDCSSSTRQYCSAVDGCCDKTVNGKSVSCSDYANGSVSTTHCLLKASGHES